MHHDTDRDGCPAKGAAAIILIVTALAVGAIAERGMRPSALINRAASAITHTASALLGTPANATTQVRK